MVYIRLRQIMTRLLESLWRHGYTRAMKIYHAIRRFIHQVSQLVRSRQVLAQIQKTALWLVTLGLVIWVMTLMLAPVKPQQRQWVQQFANQALLPRSQQRARFWSEHPYELNQLQYMRFLRIVHAEQRNLTLQTDRDQHQKSSP